MPLRLAALSLLLLSCVHDRGDCPWNGEGSASLRVDEGVGPLQGGASMCASGMIVNAGNRDRELQVCGTAFEFTFALAEGDYATGPREVTMSAPVVGSARIAFTALTDHGNAAYLAAPDPSNAVSLSANAAASGGAVSGSLSSVRMIRQSCSVADCTVFPDAIRLTGAFDARVE